MNVIDQIYNLRRNFIVIGLTGRTGSGCSTVAEILSEKDIKKLYSFCQDFNSGKIDNNARKNRIVHHFIQDNWKPFTVISASDVIFYYASLQDFDVFVSALVGAGTIISTKGKIKDTAISENLKSSLKTLQKTFEALHKKTIECDSFLENKGYKGNEPKIDEYKKLTHSLA